jgi:KDO2-lipid IV(A) lauroyltransferase
MALLSLAVMNDQRPLGKRLKYRAIYWFVRFLISFANLLPRRAWLSVCGGLGVIAYRVLPKEREKTQRHLTMAFGKERSPTEIARMTKEVFRMLGLNGGEILRAVALRTLADLNRILVTHGYENFEKAFAKGKGVMFVTCHVGAFELQVANMTLRGLTPLIIGTSLKDPRLNDLLLRFRSAHGGVAIERGKEGMKLVKTLLQGGTVALLIDQDTKVKSRFVNFFGTPAATPAGAAMLALKTKTAVVPAYIHYNSDDGMQHMYLDPELPLISTGDEEHDLVANTQVYTDFIEKAIRKHPTQWVWMHERWKTKPGEEIR